MRRRLLACAAAGAAGLALLGTAAALGRGGAGGTPRPWSVSDVDYVDPALAYYGPSWQVEYATCAKLVNHPDVAGPAAAQIRPEIAAGLPRISADGLTYMFELRRDYRFHDGTPVTARSFARALNRNADPRM